MWREAADTHAEIAGVFDLPVDRVAEKIAVGPQVDDRIGKTGQ